MDIRVETRGRKPNSLKKKTYEIVRKLYQCLRCEEDAGKAVDIQSNCLRRHFQIHHESRFNQCKAGSKVLLVPGEDFSETGKVTKSTEKNYRESQCKKPIRAKVAPTLPENHERQHKEGKGQENSENEQEQLPPSQFFDRKSEIKRNTEIQALKQDREQLIQIFQKFEMHQYLMIQHQNQLLQQLLEGTLLQNDIRKQVKPQNDRQKQQIKGQLKLESSLELKVENRERTNADQLDLLNKLISHKNWSRDFATQELIINAISKNLADNKKISQVMHNIVTQINRDEIQQSKMDNKNQKCDPKQKLKNEYETKKNILEKFLSAYGPPNGDADFKISLTKRQTKLGINADLGNGATFKGLKSGMQDYFKQKANVLVIDYPWPLDSINEQKQHFIPYPTMGIKQLFEMRIEQIQDEGLLFFWVVNSLRDEADEFIRRKGYRKIDQIVWVKEGSAQDQVGDGMGYYLRHCNETCIVALKGNLSSDAILHKFKDTIIEKRAKEHSRKPEYIYQVAEGLWPNGVYVELFGRAHNLRAGWITIGNQL